MQIKITGKELKVTEAINDYVERKMDRIAKYFDNAEADVTIRVEKNVQIAEIKVSANGEMFRAVTEDKDLYASIDKDIDIFQQLPIRHKSIICSPLLSAIDLSPYLGSWVEEVTVGGESGEQARLCDYRWVLDIRRQCVQAQVPFYFMQTGARLLKDGKLYHIPRKHQHSQARAAAIDFLPAEQLPWQAF